MTEEALKKGNKIAQELQAYRNKVETLEKIGEEMDETEQEYYSLYSNANQMYHLPLKDCDIEHMRKFFLDKIQKLQKELADL